MGGRAAKPIELHVLDGKKHFTKEEIESRKANEVHFENLLTLKPPRELYGNKNAQKKWKWLVDLYTRAGLKIVNEGDLETVIRYCLLYDTFRNFVEKNPKGIPKDLDAANRYVNTFTKISDKMLKIEELLFLTPQSRIKGFAGTANPKPKTKLEDQGFGNL